MVMSIEIKTITAIYPRGFFIQWNVRDASESGQYKFDVYRSGSQSGPWDLLASGLTDQYAIIDRFTEPFEVTSEAAIRPNQLNLFRAFVYRVVVTAPSGKTAAAVEDARPRDEGALNDLKMNQYQRKALRDFRLSLKFNGTKCCILKRRHWGVRCDCTDKKTREIVRSSCKKCWGTGIVGGYWAPQLTYARRNVSTNASAVTPQGKSDTNDTKFWMPDYPSLECDDVVVFLRDQSRWRIDQTVGTEIRLQQVHQVISAQALDRSHILYSLPVDPDVENPLL